MKFKGEFEYLSNFHPSKITRWGIEFPTVEHIFVAAKTTDMKLRREIAQISTPAKAKKFGRKLKLRPDWEEVKYQEMREAIRGKFADPRLMHQLQMIEGEIVEHNTWHDNTWGACTCQRCANRPKQNWLGRLIMEVRDE